MFGLFCCLVGMFLLFWFVLFVFGCCFCWRCFDWLIELVWLLLSFSLVWLVLVYCVCDCWLVGVICSLVVLFLAVLTIAGVFVALSIYWLWVGGVMFTAVWGWLRTGLLRCYCFGMLFRVFCFDCVWLLCMCFCCCICYLLLRWDGCCFRIACSLV